MKKKRKEDRGRTNGNILFTADLLFKLSFVTIINFISDEIPKGHTSNYNIYSFLFPSQQEALAITAVLHSSAHGGLFAGFRFTVFLQQCITISRHKATHKTRK